MISLCETCHVDSIAAAHKSGCHEIIPRANKRAQDPVVVKVGDGDAVSTLMDASELYSVLSSALCSAAPLFSHIDIASAEKLGTLPKLKASSAMRTLVQWFVDAGLDAQLGCNMTTGEISLTVQIKKEMPARPFGEQSWILWAMLGLLPCQSALEEIHSNSDNFKNLLLANECLAKFGRETGVGIRDKKMLLRTSSFRLQLCVFRPAPAGAKITGGKPAMFVFGPSYWLLSGYDEEQRVFSEEKLAAGRSALADAVLSDFWKHVEAFPYALSANMTNSVTPGLRHYITSGLQGETAAFCPANGHLALYMHGTAGTGKTTFVSAFAAALQASLRARVEPGREVKIVKVPLNSTTPSQLKSILSVQTVCKGHTVVLHLEEVPEEAPQQESLFKIVKSMLASIVRRYPLYASNVIYMLTSNYPACPSIAHEAQVLRVCTPGQAEQAAWCRLSMQRLIAAHCQVEDVSVVLQCAPPPAQDMRPLHRWCNSLAYCIARHCAALSPLERLARAKVTVATAPAAGDEHRLAVTVERETRWNLSSEDARAAGGEAAPLPPPPAAEEWPAGGARVGVQDGRPSRFMKATLPALSLASDDGFFYYIPDSVPAVSSPAVSSEAVAAAAKRGGDVSARLQALVDMCAGKWLKPAVLVLTGDRESKAAAVEEVRARMRRACAGGGGRVDEEQVVLRTAGDEDKVYGRSRDIRGGIFKRIDDMNNPNLHGAAQASLLMVECHVSAVGQYMLRELLETNDLSRTHRQAVHKDRVLFVVNVEEDAPLHDTIRSRAHVLLHCHPCQPCPSSSS